MKKTVTSKKSNDNKKAVRLTVFNYITVFKQFFFFTNYLILMSKPFVILFYLWRNKTYSLTYLLNKTVDVKPKRKFGGKAK